MKEIRNGKPWCFNVQKNANGYGQGTTTFMRDKMCTSNNYSYLNVFLACQVKHHKWLMKVGVQSLCVQCLSTSLRQTCSEYNQVHMFDAPVDQAEDT